jgi:anti-anti-sigma factor
MTKRFLGLEIEELVRERRCTLLLSGELDIASAATLHGAVARLRDSEAACDGLMLDLSGLIFIDSTGLAEVILTGQLCDRDGLDFALVPGPRAVQRLFELTGLIDALPFTGTPTPAEARDRSGANAKTSTEVVSENRRRSA